MSKPITIDLSGLGAQFGLASSQIDQLTETCINAVTASVYANWEALAKQRLGSTLPDYLQHLIKVDKGRFAKQIILTGSLPNMLEQGASPFDIKDGFKKSPKVKYTIPVYNKKGVQIKQGGDWFLSVPFRIGTPGTVGQAGFSSEMPQEVYDVMLGKPTKGSLKTPEIPSPYDIPKSRDAILNEGGGNLYAAYKHKSSIYEGMAKQTAQYAKTSQNTYGTFRRAGANSDPLSWIHKGFTAYNLHQGAISKTDVETIVENEVTSYLEAIL